jgi:hypothetical protein
MGKITKSINKYVNRIFFYLNDYISAANKSKLFAGLMIITLNIASKFVTIKLSKTMESYLKYTFSKQILVFAMAWMGTRDIYVAFFITVVFVICMDYLFHEDSMFCCLPEAFRDYHLDLINNDKVSDEEIMKAKVVLEKAERQKEQEENSLSLENPTSTNTQQRQQVLY